MKADYNTRLRAFENEKKVLIYKNMSEFEYLQAVKKLADKYDI